MKQELTCIVCPIGCQLTIDNETYDVKGNRCQRGIVYAKKEITNPTRIVTSTVKITGGIYNRLPVKTDGEIPKELIFSVMDKINNVVVQSPVKMGEIIIPNVLNTGVNIVSTRSM